MDLVQFTHKMCIAACNHKKNHLKPIFFVKGHSRSSMLVLSESSLAVLVMISCKTVSICNHSRARLVDSRKSGSMCNRSDTRRANSGKKNNFLGGTPLDAVIQGKSPHPAA